MDFTLTDEQQAIRAAARKFAQAELAPRAAEFDEQESVPPSLYERLAEQGYFGMLVPEEYGGAAMDLMSYTLVLQEFARASASVMVGLAVHNTLACGALLAFGSREQKEKYLPRLVAGEFGAYSLTEPGSGSDAGSLRCRAVLEGDHYVVDGNKCFVTNAGLAKLVVLFVSTKPEAKNKGISCLLVELPSAGATVGAKEKKMGIRGSDTRELTFADCAVPAANLLGKSEQGFAIALSLLEGGRIGIAAQSIGIAEAAFAEAVRYAQERKQFGQSIASFQAIQFKLAAMATRIEAARLLMYAAVVKKAAGGRVAQEASMAKWFASQTANFVASEAVQIFGGYGYIRDSAVERYFRDARITEIYEGTSEVQQMVIAREILG